MSIRLTVTLVSVWALICTTTPVSAQPKKSSTDPYKPIAAIVEEIKGLAKEYQPAAEAFELQDKGGTIIKTEVTEEDKKKGYGPLSIWCLKVGSGKDKILVTGTLHAREWVAYPCVLEAAKFLLKNKTETKWPDEARFAYFEKYKKAGFTPKSLFEATTIYFVPVANPSGYAYSLANDEYPQGIIIPDERDEKLGWRKNRRDVKGDPQQPGERELTEKELKITPYIGVDLNRNFPVEGVKVAEESQGIDWGTKTNRTSRYRFSFVYCGRPVGNWNAKPLEPNQEKESLALLTLANKITPVGAIDLHSYSPFVLFPLYLEGKKTLGVPLTEKETLSDQRAFFTIATRAGKLVTKGAEGPYPTSKSGTTTVELRDGGTAPYIGSGELKDWLYRSQPRCISTLIEIGKTDFRPKNPEDYARGVLPGMIFLMSASVKREFAVNPTDQMDNKKEGWLELPKD